eukprot:8345120-Lingulodinium_polyedra.AAC.1
MQGSSMARKPPPPTLPAGLETWAGPASPGPPGIASAGPAHSAPVLAPGLAPESCAARPYTQVRAPPPPLEAWDPIGRPHN